MDTVRGPKQKDAACKTSRERSQVDPIIQLWLLRMLVPLETYQSNVGVNGIKSERLVKAVGLGSWVDQCDTEFNPRIFAADLRKKYQDAEHSFGRTKAPRTLRQNIKRLGVLVGLSPVDCRILEFVVLLHAESLLDDAADHLGQLNSVKIMRILSVLLGLPLADVRASLASQGLLARSGLVTIDPRGTGYLRAKLDLLSQDFADRVLCSDADPVALLRDVIAPTAPATLSMADFSHVQDALSVMLPYLRHAAGDARRGVNVFIYGPPGTGKSELARAVAAELGKELFQVASEDSDGDPIGGERRLRAYRAGQSFLTGQSTLIVFDEVEDVFNGNKSLFSMPSAAQTRKAWMNRALEENPVPTLWLSNSIDGIDPAFVRRFDMVLELPVPPKRQRQAIIRQACDGLLDEETVLRIAEVETLVPAVVSRAASVVRTIRADLGAAAAQDAVVQLVSGTLAGQGHGRLPARTGASAAPYDPALVRCDTDLAALAAGLQPGRAGRLCLYGPPGTGKTAFGRWLAEQLDMPLQVVRASDLLSAYVGQTEGNIAGTFRAAADAGALLMIDEVDSFLQDRRGAQRSWEVTAVNEMLTQIECFMGLLVVSTNLIDGLDQAALRRFDLKLKFDYLDAAQARALLERHCEALGLAGAADAFPALNLVRQLTPGDFAAVARQHRFRPLGDAGAFTRALAVESGLKGQEASKPIGFMH
jgi:transitional endoplasmic reticulum ATPase